MMSRLALVVLAVLSLFSFPVMAAPWEALGPVQAGGSAVWNWNLELKAHVPDGARGKSGPVVVLIHGCGQSGQEFAQESGWRGLSETKGFALLAVEFRDYVAGASGKDCPWWFDAEQRIPSETTLAGRILRGVATLRDAYAIQGGENYVTGLSAGAGMALVLLATYPDDFAAGAPIAGLPVGCAQIATNKGGTLFMTPELRRAFGCMEGPAGVNAQDWWREVVRTVPSRRSWPRLSIWQGDADPTVACVNALEIAQQWAGLNGLEVPAFSSCADVGRNPPPHDPVWSANRGNETVVEMRILPNFPHAWPIEPRTGCGRNAANAVPADVCAAAEIARFFGIE